jgi:hypothetical protein
MYCRISHIYIFPWYDWHRNGVLLQTRSQYSILHDILEALQRKGKSIYIRFPRMPYANMLNRRIPKRTTCVFRSHAGSWVLCERRILLLNDRSLLCYSPHHVVPPINISDNSWPQVVVTPTQILPEILASWIIRERGFLVALTLIPLVGICQSCSRHLNRVVVTWLWARMGQGTHSRP